ncbi:MAG: hypothetical protein JST00_24965 [Deltaproteobacteria bacterium]|nr:hypothetical protein [Deltaproteobacteria bacterium]
MIGHELETKTGEDMVRVVRALGQHRYVASRLHLVHAFVIEAAMETDDAARKEALAEAATWARSVLTSPAIDRASKDERLYRAASDAELVAALGAFWTPGEGRERVSLRLAERLVEIEVEPPDLEATPFDEDREEDMFPVLVDAGWELLPLAKLDPERHKGAIQAFAQVDDEIGFDAAKFDEENTVPPVTPLMELPAMGTTELLAGIDGDGAARAPFVVWTEGNETYVDYLLRGVKRAAKLE